MKSSREHEDEGYLSVRESGESARLPAPQAAVILLSTIVARGGSNRHAQHGAREAAASVPPAQGSLPVAAGAAWRRAALGVMTAGAFGVTSALCDGGSPLFSARVLSRTDVASTKWLKLQSITYQDPAGKQRLWDVCTRTTRPAASSAAASRARCRECRGAPGWLKIRFSVTSA